MERWFFSVWQMSTVITLMFSGIQAEASQSQSAYFLPEFALSPQGSFLEDTTGEKYLTYRYDDQVSIKHVHCNGAFTNFSFSLSV
ncbi:hypothetical protein AMELA_G00135700 [Ameiurus melas]|uniref:Uncharacterized protein n=1 Tax=Ameiurus melas TaxID=219545 RepID=A0A7J6AJQ9_AMEME|nr:hypothetical protein AMELA_G00135700 [Ameiurus melas]